MNNTKKTCMREFKEEMGPNFIKKMVDKEYTIGSWGKTTVSTCIVKGTSRNKDFKKNRETDGVVLAPLNQSFQGNSIVILNDKGDGFIEKNNVSKFVKERLTDNFIDGLKKYLIGDKCSFGRGISSFKNNLGGAMLPLINYKDKTNNIVIPCLYLVKENKSHKTYGGQLNICAGKYEFKKDGLIGRKKKKLKWICTFTKKNIVIWRKGNNWSYINPHCKVIGCWACKKGQTHKCSICGSSHHRAKVHFNNGRIYFKGNCKAMGCITCRRNNLSIISNF